ncbi:hypothetical protein AGMMS49992_10920 [Clostridia bacterium]|nr:hypothetical protein AGMMS49992_10920 [Clostridia bacterium]
MACKELYEMTLEELWELFPIVLRDHNPAYADWYEEQRAEIVGYLSAHLFRISHIGSSAVPGLLAKPTVDMLLELNPEADVDDVRQTLTDHGWGLMREVHEPHFQMSFNRGYTPDGFAEKVYHLHVRYAGDWGEPYFRDYLRLHPETANAYAMLKQQLLKQYEHDRDRYTDEKHDFVSSVTKAARLEFLGRYMP